MERVLDTTADVVVPNVRRLTLRVLVSNGADDSGNT